MSRKVPGAGRFDGFYINPEELTLITEKTHPLYDERVDLPVAESHVLNVMALGVREPILVISAENKYVVVDGRQRVKWALAANKRLKAQGEETIRVPVKFEKGNAEENMDLMIALNEVRQDEELLVKAEKLKRFLSRGRSEEEAAVRFGVHVRTIKNWLQLDEVCPAVRKAVVAGQISVSAASTLSKKDRPEQEQALEKLLSTATVSKSGKKRKATAKKAKALVEGARERPSIRKLVAEYTPLRLDASARHMLDFVLGGVSENFLKEHHPEWWHVSDVEKQVGAGLGSGDTAANSESDSGGATE